MSWQGRFGFALIKFYNHLINKGYKVNSARSWSIGPRSFFAAKVTALKVKGGAIARVEIATNEHRFL